MDKITENFLYHVSYFQELMHMAYSDAIEAYDSLEKYEGDNKYIIALNFLNMANQNYLEVKRVNHEYELDHNEINPFFEAFDHYKFQFKQVISEKDKNTSWLFSAKEDLIARWKEADEFIKQSIKNNNR
jgi:hypothetical protein